MFERNRYASLVEKCEEVFKKYKVELVIPDEFLDPIIPYIMEFPVKVNKNTQRCDVNTLIQFWDSIYLNIFLCQDRAANDPLTNLPMENITLDEELKLKIEDYISNLVNQANGLLSLHGDENVITDFIYLERKERERNHQRFNLDALIIQKGHALLLDKKHQKLAKDAEMNKQEVAKLLKEDGHSEAYVNDVLQNLTYQKPLYENVQVAFGLFGHINFSKYRTTTTGNIPVLDLEEKERNESLYTAAKNKFINFFNSLKVNRVATPKNQAVIERESHTP